MYIYSCIYPSHYVRLLYILLETSGYLVLLKSILRTCASACNKISMKSFCLSCTWATLIFS